MDSIQAEKTCSKCRQTLPVSAFHRDKQRIDGRFPYCKRCRAPNKGLWQERRDNHGLKRCSVCRQWQPLASFGSNASRGDGYHSECRQCATRTAQKAYAKDPERTREKHRREWEQNREKQQAEYRRWLASPLGKASTARRFNRRKRHIAAAICDLTAAEWEEIIVSQAGCCLACGRRFGPELKPTRDHVVPVSLGGGLTKANVQALCRGCNARKQARIIDYRGSQK